MLTLIAAIVGLFVGWNLPQPEWAKTIQAKVLSYFK